MCVFVVLRGTRGPYPRSPADNASDEFIFPMTIHPDVSGRPHALLMHERIIEHINKHEGVEWVTMAEICDRFKAQNSVPDGALMPASREEVMEKYSPWKASQ